MRIRWLGWAGVEVEEQGEWLVVDPLQDAGAVFAWMGEKAATMPRPDVVSPRGGAVAGLVTHLHRGQAGGGGLAGGVGPGALVDGAESYGGGGGGQPAVGPAGHELRTAGLDRRPTAAWTSTSAG